MIQHGLKSNLNNKIMTRKIRMLHIVALEFNITTVHSYIQSIGVEFGC